MCARTVIEGSVRQRDRTSTRHSFWWQITRAALILCRSEGRAPRQRLHRPRRFQRVQQFWHRSVLWIGIRGASLVIGVVVGPTATSASPSFARQTEQPSTSCHAAFPALTLWASIQASRIAPQAWIRTRFSVSPGMGHRPLGATRKHHKRICVLGQSDFTPQADRRENDECGGLVLTGGHAPRHCSLRPEQSTLNRA